MNTDKEQQLTAALRDSQSLIEEAQTILARCLQPDGDEKAAIIELLALLDGPEQRRVQAAARAALEASRLGS